MSDTLEELVKQNALSIEVQETPWGEKEVFIDDDRSGKYNLTSEQSEQITELIDLYKDIILDIHQIIEQYDGIEQMWEIGSIADDKVYNGELSASQFSLFAGLSPTGEGTHLGQCKNIYNYFPDKNYSTEQFTKSALGELTHTVDEDTAQKINRNAAEFNIYVGTKQTKALRDAYKSDSLEECVSRTTSRQLLSSESVHMIGDRISNAYVLLGREIDTSELLPLIRSQREK